MCRIQCRYIDSTLSHPESPIFQLSFLVLVVELFLVINHAIFHVGSILVSIFRLFHRAFDAFVVSMLQFDQMARHSVEIVHDSYETKQTQSYCEKRDPYKSVLIFADCEVI